MNYANTNEYQYLVKFYTPNQIEIYSKGDWNKIQELYRKTQPKHIPISKLMGKTENNLYYVSSPDGWVPVLDCIEKIKDKLFTITLADGKKVTASHDHLYQKKDGTWIYARDLQPTDELMTLEGSSKLLKIERLNKKTKVYDLSVNHNNHRYYTAGISSHNSGKSLLMQNQALNWVLAGLNGIYFTLELSEALCSMRLDSMITNIPSREIFKRIDDVELKVKITEKSSGALQIKYMPSGSSCNNFRGYMKEYITRKGVKPDFVIIDYLDLCSPNDKKVDPSNLFVKDKYVSEEMRNLAKEFNCVCVTGSQLNRSAVEEVEFDHSHIAGGLSKINTADNVIGIFTSRAMRERGLYQVQFMKTRSSSGVGRKVELEFNIDTLRITNSTNSEQNTSTASTLLQSIRRTASTTNISSDGVVENLDEQPKIAGKSSSARLQGMLNNITRGSNN